MHGGRKNEEEEKRRGEESEGKVREGRLHM